MTQIPPRCAGEVAGSWYLDEVMAFLQAMQQGTPVSIDRYQGRITAVQCRADWFPGRIMCTLSIEGSLIPDADES